MAIVEEILGFFVNNPSIIAVGILLSAFIFVLSLLFSGPTPGPNPFAKDAARPVKPFVADPATRDKVLKQGFKVKDIPDNLDAIVVGSGMGGLTIAAILAKAGKKVLVLEQHDQAGGCLHTFVDKGFEFDVGIHYIGEMTTNTVSRLLVNQLTEGQLEWVELDKEFDIVALGEPGKQRKYPIVTGREEWKQTLHKQFPGEEKAIDKFFELLKDVRKSTIGSVILKVKSKWLSKLLIMTGLIHKMTNYYSYACRSLQDVLDELTDNKDLKAVLAYNFGDYGTLPKDASFATHCGLINHYLMGSTYPRGGSSEFAFHMIPVIEKTGGKVMVRAPVSEILTDSAGRAYGVRVHKTSGDIDIHAPLIISDAGVINTFKKLLPKEVAAKSSIAKLIEKRVKSGHGAMSLFVGLRGTQEELGLKRQNVWAFTGTELHDIAEQYLTSTAEQAMESDVPLLFISFPSTKDPTSKDRYPGKSTCTVVTLANWDWFAKWQDKRVMKRGEDYERVKNAIAEKMWNQVVALYPQLKDKVEYMDIGSPVTNNYYIAAPKGEIYGLDHNTERFASTEICMTLRPDTDIPGLMLTGQDIFSCGFSGAMLGGALCAGKILNRNIFDDLVNLKKQLTKSK